MPFGRQKTSQEIAKEVNGKFREAIRLYSAEKITLEQVIEKFYKAQKIVQPNTWLDTQFQSIALDQSGMNRNEIVVFGMACYRAKQRSQKEFMR